MSISLSSLISSHNFRSLSIGRVKYSAFSVDEDVRNKQIKNFRIQRRMLANEIPKIIDVV